MVDTPRVGALVAGTAGLFAARSSGSASVEMTHFFGEGLQHGSHGAKDAGDLLEAALALTTLGEVALFQVIETVYGAD